MKTVLITGASRGIGKATAKIFASAGWNILLIARSKNDLATLSNELNEIGSKVFFECIDLSNPREISNGIKNLLSNGLSPSVLINNAGVAWTGGANNYAFRAMEMVDSSKSYKHFSDLF